MGNYRTVREEDDGKGPAPTGTDRRIGTPDTRQPPTLLLIAASAQSEPSTFTKTSHGRNEQCD